MISPTAFESNAQATSDNHFMSPTADGTSAPASSYRDRCVVTARVVAEHASLVRVLREEIGAVVHVFDHAREHGTPDAVFPNNWFSTDARGRVTLYPMRHPSRRAERRADLVAWLEERYGIERPSSATDDGKHQRGVMIDMTSEETRPEGPRFLEGTGALVLDRTREVAYACLSERCDENVARAWAETRGYRLITFRARDEFGRPIYHTNVMMSVGTRGAVVCRPSVSEEAYDEIARSLRATGRDVVDIDFPQMAAMCGNVLEVLGRDGKKCLLMSRRARESFSDAQMAQIENAWDAVHVAAIPTLEEIGGGGVRCCVAELF